MAGRGRAAAPEWDRIGDLVTLGAQREPDRVALRPLGGADRTYAQLDERTTRLANALLAQGLTSGDRVVAWLETCAEYVELYLAAAKAGLVLVPVNNLLTAGEAAAIVSDCQPRALFHSTRFTDVLDTINCDAKVTVAVAATVQEPSSEFEEFLASGGLDPLDGPDPDDLFIIGYTSGTTGTPKGAMLTHSSVLAVCRAHAIGYRTPLYSVACYNSNMSFVATITALVMAHFYVLGTLVITAPAGVEAMLDIIEQERCTLAFLPAPLIRPFIEVAKARPESWQHVRTFVHAGSKVDPGDIRELVDLVGPRFIEAWGMTEIGGIATVTDADDFRGMSAARDVFGSVGRPAVGTLLRVVDEEGNDLPHDGVSEGELLVRSPSIMAGYWRRPDATAEAVRDGWYHSGDVGAIDAAGYVYVHERRTDMIVSGGMNIYPSEVEKIIGQYPGVAAVAVVGVPHPRWGQSPAAVIELDESATVEAEEILELCRTELASYKKPTAVHFVDRLPINASNKILRRKVREMLADGRDPGK